MSVIGTTAALAAWAAIIGAALALQPREPVARMHARYLDALDRVHAAVVRPRD